MIHNPIETSTIRLLDEHHLLTAYPDKKPNEILKLLDLKVVTIDTENKRNKE